jgi:hypothetical protein
MGVLAGASGVDPAASPPATSPRRVEHHEAGGDALANDGYGWRRRDGGNLADGGVGLAPLTWPAPSGLQAELDRVKADIIAGRIPTSLQSGRRIEAMEKPGAVPRQPPPRSPPKEWYNRSIVQ